MPTDRTMRALALGPRELLSGFSAFGVEVRHATTKEEALEAVRDVKAAQSSIPYGIIFIIEGLSSNMNESEYAELLGDDLPVVLTIPDLTSKKDAGLEKLRSLAKRAIGSDIFSGQ